MSLTVHHNPPHHNPSSPTTTQNQPNTIKMNPPKLAHCYHRKTTQKICCHIHHKRDQRHGGVGLAWWDCDRQWATWWEASRLDCGIQRSASWDLPWVKSGMASSPTGEGQQGWEWDRERGREWERLRGKRERDVCEERKSETEKWYVGREGRGGVRES